MIARRLPILSALFAFSVLAQAPPATRAVVAEGVADLYERPDETSPVDDQAILGETVEVLEETAGFARVRAEDGNVAWIPERSIRREDVKGFIQRRPILGREAYKFPKRGFGIETYRQRLRRAGIDPDNMPAVTPLAPLTGPPVSAPRAAAGEDPMENPAHFLGLLDELHDGGVLTDDEYGAARLRLLERLRS